MVAEDIILVNKIRERQSRLSRKLESERRHQKKEKSHYPHPEKKVHHFFKKPQIKLSENPNEFAFVNQSGPSVILSFPLKEAAFTILSFSI